MKKFGMILAAMVFALGTQMVSAASLDCSATTSNYTLMDEEVTLIVDEPVESGDILVDEDGGVWEVQ
ncbi:hypothetical protein D081_2119 [Anaerovibrio sp. JC8]|uniref:hypothetical protein n=1 Tax=Anaerovibrio sp. JC8 TaxID=1240085 RepID=UPI000A0E3019|nr:hypothetical protein [Anaerovibrio sp. JC8]ORT99149.1 hypothetical protein D081_2119 [Anaerovibrio sp. JC8]